MNQNDLQQQNLEKLQSLAADSDNVLCVVKSVFPFQIFPSILTVEKTKIVYTKHFFLGQHTESILINGILSVQTETALFLSSIEIISRTPNTPSILVPNLPIQKARETVDIIQGLMVSYQANADLSSLSSEAVVDSVREIGTTKTEETLN